MAKITLYVDESRESQLAKEIFSHSSLDYESVSAAGHSLPSAMYKNQNYDGLDGIMFLLNILSNPRKILDELRIKVY